MKKVSLRRCAPNTGSQIARSHLISLQLVTPAVGSPESNYLVYALLSQKSHGNSFRQRAARLPGEASRLGDDGISSQFQWLGRADIVQECCRNAPRPSTARITAFPNAKGIINHVIAAKAGMTWTVAASAWMLEAAFAGTGADSAAIAGFATPGLQTPSAPNVSRSMMAAMWRCAIARMFSHGCRTGGVTAQRNPWRL